MQTLPTLVPTVFVDVSSRRIRDIHGFVSMKSGKCVLQKVVVVVTISQRHNNDRRLRTDVRRITRCAKIPYHVV